MKSKISGYLRMLYHRELKPVNYYFKVVNYKSSRGNDYTEEKISLNEFVGKKIKLEFSGEIRCVDCGSVTKKTFGGGSCYNCFQSLASNDMCIMRPSQCHFHLNTCREPEWGKDNCFKPHIVYLANTTGLKVGITKENPYSKRWVDQGARQGLPIFRVQSRKDSGILEDELSKFVSDKASWQQLISSDSQSVDLIEESKKLFSQIDISKKGFEPEILSPEVTEIVYPVLSYPSKKVSLKPDPNKPLESILIGIKGQYLLFEEGGMNIRSLEGYSVRLSTDL